MRGDEVETFTHHFKGGLAVRVALILICFLWTLPTAGLLVSSFRPADDISRSGWWTTLQSPLDFTLENYQFVINADGMGRAFLNSLTVTIPATVIPIAIAAFAAYAFAWMEFPGRRILFVIVVGLLRKARIQALVCRWRFSCCGTTSARCRRN